MKTEAPRISPFSIKGASGLGARTESAGGEASCGGSGQEADPGCEPVSRWEELFRSKRRALPLRLRLCCGRLRGRSTLRIRGIEAIRKTERARRGKRISDPEKNFDDHCLDWAQD